VWATVAALGAAPAWSETGAGAATATPKQPIDYVLDLPAQGVRAVRDALRGDPSAREPGSGEGEGEGEGKGKGDAQGGAPGKQAALNVGKAGIAVLVADAVVVLFMGSRVLDAMSPAAPDPERPQPRGWKEKLVDSLMANQDGNDDTPKDASSSSPPRTEGSDDDAGLSP